MNKITVLIPCYNKEKFYNKLFESLIKQTFKNFDVIFLNDSSTDNTLFILQKFQKENKHIFNIQIIDLKENKGISYARNRLIRNVKTDYFLFLDPDDTLDKNAIFYFNKELEKEKYEIIFAKYSLIFKGLKIPNFLTHKKMLFSNVEKENFFFIKYNQPFIWNHVINTKWFLKQNLIFLEGYHYEDVPITFILHLISKKTKFINKRTYKYDLNLQGLSKKHSVSKVVGIAHNLDYLYKNLNKFNVLETFSNEGIEKRFLKNIFLISFASYCMKIMLKKENRKKYFEAMNKLLSVIEDLKLDKKLYQSKKWFNFLLRKSLKNYEKSKKYFL